MARPFFSSSFCALMIGGRNAPSEGGLKTTMESGSGAWADAGAAESSAVAQARLAKSCFMTSSRPKLFRGAFDRRLEFLAKCGEKPPDQMLGNARENALADARHQAADFAHTLIGQARSLRAFGRNLEARAAIAVTQRTGAGNLDAARSGRLLVGERDLALERATDRGDTQLHLDLVGIWRDLDHRLAAGDAPRQHHRIIQRLPQRFERRLNGLGTANIELHPRTSLTGRTIVAPGRH